MGARGSRRATKPAKKSKFSAQEKVERARVGAKTARRDLASRPVRSNWARSDVAQVRRRYKRNPLPRANRNPKTAPGGGAPRRPRG